MNFSRQNLIIGDGGGDTGGVCNCLTGTPHVNPVTHVCTCITTTAGGGVNSTPNIPPHPTTPAPNGYVWQFDNSLHAWVLTPIYASNVNYPNGVVPHASLLNPLGLNGVLSGDGASTFFANNKGLVYLGAAGLALYLLSK